MNEGKDVFFYFLRVDLLYFSFRSAYINVYYLTIIYLHGLVPVSLEACWKA